LISIKAKEKKKSKLKSIKDKVQEVNGLEKIYTRKSKRLAESIRFCGK